VQTLEIVLDAMLEKYENEYGMQNIAAKPSIRFDSLIAEIHKKTGKKVGLSLTFPTLPPIFGTVSQEFVRANAAIFETVSQETADI
jgi:hypothetical protein